MRVHFDNKLDAASNIHWHGLIVPPAMDGHPQDVAGPGGTYVYEFEIRNRAGTYWYHPHVHGSTGPQAYQGLAGLFLVEDDEEGAAGLPAGDQDIPLVIQDRTFDADNQLIYLGSDMMEPVMGFLGQQILVNGRPDFTLPVATRAYRLRLLNGSNSRIYKLAWEDGTPLTVIASDGGLLQKPVERPYLTLAPAERVELWVDFSRYPVGSEIRLLSLAFSGVEAGDMMDGAMSGNEMGSDPLQHGGGSHMGQMIAGEVSAPPNGAPLTVCTVRVERAEQETRVLPETLSMIERHRPEDAVNGDSPRRFGLFMQRMQWTINGRSFAMTDVAAEETVDLGTLEVWEFANERGPAGMGEMADFMAHPIHVHGLQFQVLERQVAAEWAAGWESIRDGYVDEGWKDTVLVMPGERVKLLVRFDGYAGLYVYHCHNLEHEDMGMMRNYRVRGS